MPRRRQAAGWSGRKGQGSGATITVPTTVPSSVRAAKAAASGCSSLAVFTALAGWPARSTRWRRAWVSAGSTRSTASGGGGVSRPATRATVPSAVVSAAEPTPVPDADDVGRAAAVAAIARALAARAEMALPPDLRLWALAGPGPVGPEDAVLAAGDVAGAVLAAGDVAGALGAALEGGTGGGRRRAQGLHVTPRWLAARLVDRALPGGAVGGTSVCDPACGGGAFLVAAAEWLHRAGVDRREIVRRHLWG